MRVSIRAALRGPAAPCLLAAILAAPWACPSRTFAQADTVEVTTGALGSPVVASVPVGDLAPLYGRTHLLYSRDEALRHAWKVPDPWQIETVAASATSYDLVVRGDGLPVCAFADAQGRLICGERSPSAWTLDTLAVHPGSSLLVSLAIGPEPRIAYLETPAAGPRVLRYARKAGGNWVISTLDATAPGPFGPSLALDRLGNPAVAYSRVAATLSGYEIRLFESTGPDGPFSPSLVDSQAIGPLSLVWDGARDRPFVHYRARRPDDGVRIQRVAYRDLQNAWHWQFMGLPFSNTDAAAALALDPLGGLGAVWLRVGPSQPEGCVPEPLHSMHLSGQPSGVPTAHFSHTDIATYYGVDATCSDRAVSSYQPGLFEVCWRSPQIDCPPFAILLSEIQDGTTSVYGDHAPRIGVLEVQPVVRGAWAPLTVRWSQPLDAEARLELHDVAGRRIASRDLGFQSAGPHEVSWRPEARTPGIYWVSLRLAGETAGSRACVTR